MLSLNKKINLHACLFLCITINSLPSLAQQLDREHPVKYVEIYTKDMRDISMIGFSELKVLSKNRYICRIGLYSEDPIGLQYNQFDTFQLKIVGNYIYMYCSNDTFPIFSMLSNDSILSKWAWPIGESCDQTGYRWTHTQKLQDSMIKWNNQNHLCYHFKHKVATKNGYVIENIWISKKQLIVLAGIRRYYDENGVEDEDKSGLYFVW